MRTLTVFFSYMCFLAAAPVSALDNPCDMDYVSVDGAGMLIEPTGDDDTSNIQCALDSAAVQGITSVKLSSGSFYISQLFTENYVGEFSGKSKAATSLIAQDSGIACEEDDISRAPGIITFAGGNVSVKTMSVEVDRPCSEGLVYRLLHFTQASCSARTYFSTVDRLEITNRASLLDNVATAISVTGNPDCVSSGKGPLGTAKVNRTELNTFSVGFESDLLGAAQVDINFNTFTNVGYGVQLRDANQNTTITGNRIAYILRGVASQMTVASAPTKNRIVVHKNVFEQEETYREASAIEVQNLGRRADQSVVITSNRVNITRNESEGYYQSGVVLFDVDGALVANNTLSGTGFVGVFVDSKNFSTTVTKTSITGNTFNMDPSIAHIALGEGTADSVVGPKQFASVFNNGVDNLVGF